MELFVTADYMWDAKLEQGLDIFDYHMDKSDMKAKNYGQDIELISVVFRCQPHLDMGIQKVRYSKAERILKLDLFLDYYQMRLLEAESKYSTMMEVLVDCLEVYSKKSKLKRIEWLTLLADLKSL